MAAPGQESVGYRIWAVDNIVYGPVELPVLVQWVKEERVVTDTWVFSERVWGWKQAKELEELQMFFGRSRAENLGGNGQTASDTVLARKAEGAVRPGMLRRVKVFAGMSDDQLARFIEFMEVNHVKQWTQVVKQDDPGDAMYLVLEGEVRVRLMIGGKETILATLDPGEFFGEISLFDHGPRSADVVANMDSVLLKISASAFHKLANEAPELASPFLLAIGKTLTSRIRADNKRFRDSVSFARARGGA